MDPDQRTTGDPREARTPHEVGALGAGQRDASPSDAGSPDARELVAAGTAQFLAGDSDQGVQSLQRAFHQQVSAGATREALATAFLLGTIVDRLGQQTLAQGWLARSQRLLRSIPQAAGHPPPERGYVALLELRRALAQGRFDQMVPLADEIVTIGELHADADLVAFGAVSQGRLTIYGGEVASGLALLDEAVTTVLAGEASPLTAGVVFCIAIEGCQEVGALDRVRRWTDALVSWCGDQPGLAAFAGACALHHGQVLALSGDWDEAVAAFDAARVRYLGQGERGGASAALRDQADLMRLRGELTEAAQAYQAAVDLGCDPQPGLALLWLAEGRPESAGAAVRRWLVETQVPMQRAPRLFGAVEVLLAVGDLDQVRCLTAELDELAVVTGCAPVASAAAHAHALVELVGGDPAAALPYARKAMALWGEVGCPHEVARCQLTLAAALEAVGDVESAVHEERAASRTLAALGVPVQEMSVHEVSTHGGSVRGPSLHGLSGHGLSASGTSVGSDRGHPGHEDGAPGLTPRELEVLALVSAGESNRGIARSLTLSERTVARHLSNIFTKLGVPSRTAAASYAYEHHLAGERPFAQPDDRE